MEETTKPPIEIKLSDISYKKRGDKLHISILLDNGKVLKAQTDFINLLTFMNHEDEDCRESAYTYICELAFKENKIDSEFNLLMNK